MATWVLCSWCHAENEVGTAYCGRCGHRANAPRLFCDCPSCGETPKFAGLGIVQAYEFNDAEDGNTYRWNATLGRRLAEERRRAIVTVDLAQIGMTVEKILSLCPDLDVAKARSFPLEALFTPLLFVEHRGKNVLIDGWHRLYKAAALGIDILPAFVLAQDEADAIRL